MLFTIPFRRGPKLASTALPGVAEPYPLIESPSPGPLVLPAGRGRRSPSPMARIDVSERALERFFQPAEEEVKRIQRMHPCKFVVLLCGAAVLACSGALFLGIVFPLLRHVFHHVRERHHRHQYLHHLHHPPLTVRPQQRVWMQVDRRCDGWAARLESVDAAVVTAPGLQSTNVVKDATTLPTPIITPRLADRQPLHDALPVSTPELVTIPSSEGTLTTSTALDPLLARDSSSEAPLELRQPFSPSTAPSPTPRLPPALPQGTSNQGRCSTHAPPYGCAIAAPAQVSESVRPMPLDVVVLVTCLSLVSGLIVLLWEGHRIAAAWQRLRISTYRRARSGNRRMATGAMRRLVLGAWALSAVSRPTVVGAMLTLPLERRTGSVQMLGDATALRSGFSFTTNMAIASSENTESRLSAGEKRGVIVGFDWKELVSSDGNDEKFEKKADWIEESEQQVLYEDDDRKEKEKREIRITRTPSAAWTSTPETPASIIAARRTRRAIVPAETVLAPIVSSHAVLPSLSSSSFSLSTTLATITTTTSTPASLITSAPTHPTEAAAQHLALHHHDNNDDDIERRPQEFHGLPCIPLRPGGTCVRYRADQQLPPGSSAWRGLQYVLGLRADDVVTLRGTRVVGTAVVVVVSSATRGSG